MVEASCKILGTFDDLQIREMDRIDRKGLCCGGGFFCNTMLDDGVKETTAAIAVTEIAEIFNLATG